MTATLVAGSDPSRELGLTRLIEAPRHDVWRCWTEPDLVRRWFAPLPWTTPEVAFDLRPGGVSRVVMRSPAGEEITSHGLFLDVVEDALLVLTDAYVSAWVPSDKPFLTVIVTLADEAEGTRYSALARHWTAKDRARHEAMGFHQGWATCADQLEALAQTL